MGFIYIIKNTINEKVYIGQTTNTIEYRFSQHLDCAKRDYKNSALYSAMRKYGKEYFYIEPIEEVPFEKLDEREIYWISYYDSYNNGYNSTIGGSGNKKINYDLIIKDWYDGLSEYDIRKKHEISEATIWKILNLYNISEEDRKLRFAQSKQQNTDEKILELWNNGYGLREIKREFGGGRGTIKKQLLRQGITEEEIHQRGIAKRGKTVKQYSLDGEYIATYNTTSEAGRAIGRTDGGNIGQAAQGKRKTAYGYRWKYK